MDYKKWLEQIKESKTDLAEFVTKLEPHINDNGLNIASFEKSVSAGVKKAEESALSKINND